MKKRVFSGLLALTMLLSLLPTAAWAEEGGASHSHPVCGASCTHAVTDPHGAVTWTALTQDSFTGGADSGPKEGSGVTLNFAGTGYILAAGSYYLTGDITVGKEIRITEGTGSGTVNLCLNGHTFTSTVTGNPAITVPDNVTLWLCDCQSGGKIASGADILLKIGTKPGAAAANLYGGTLESSGGNCCVQVYSKLTLDGATLKARGYAIDTVTNSSVTIKSGTVESSNTKQNQAYGVHVQTADFTMTGGEIKHTANGEAAVYFVTSGGGTISGGTITSMGNYGISLDTNGTVTLSGSPTISGKTAGIAIGYAGLITVGEGLAGKYTVYKTGSSSITEPNPFPFTTASNADHSALFSPVPTGMAGVGVRNSGTGSAQKVELYREHDYDRSWTYDADQHWKACSNPGCTAPKNDLANHDKVWNPHGQTQHWQMCTVCGWTGERTDHAGAGKWVTNDKAHWKLCSCGSQKSMDLALHSYDNDQDADCNICGYTRAVPLTGTVTVAGTPKLGEKLTASVTDAPQGVALKYAWTITGGDGTVLSGTDAYTPTANDVGKTLTVTVTTDDTRYTGSLSAVTSAVAKGDQAAPVGIFTITDAADEQSKGVIVITGDASMLEYRLKSTDGSDPAWAAAASSNELTAGTYEFRYKETATHNASPATEVQVRVLGPDAKRLTIGTITHGTVEKRRDMVNPGDPVTLAVKPADGYELTDIAAIYNDGTADKIITPTVKPDNAQQYTFTMPNADVTVTATFTAIVYTINYQWANVADGSFTVEDGTITLATPTRENYILTGWAFAENGAVIENVTAAVLAAQAAARTVKLYPIWTENETPPPEGETKGEVEVKPGTPAVSADKEVLKELAEEVQQGSDTVTVRLTVEKLDDPADKDELESVISGDKDKVLYLDLALLKQVNDSAPEAITNASRVLEIAVDFDFTGKKDVAVYRKHGGNDAEELAALSTRPAGSYTDGTFFAASGNGKVYIYTSKFSTYAIGYTTASQTAYTLTVNGGTGSGSYAAGTTVNISAVIPGGKRFTGWTGAVVTNSSSANTTLVMPAQNTTVTANFQNISGGGGGWSGPTAYPIEIPGTDGGKVTASPKNAASGTTVTLTLIPDEGYEAGGVTVTDRSGKQVAVTVKGDGIYTFTMPSGKVTVTGVFIKIAGGYKDCPKDSTCPIWPYTDASATAWYHDGVHYCLEHNLMVGVGAYAFAPDGTTSRAMIAVILWRLEGSPVVNYVQPFDDVAEGTWYAEAIRWAAAGGVVSGYGDGTFGPGDPVTREQLAVMLWRYAGSPAASQELNFTDTHRISGYALEAVRWAAENGILSGYSDRRADPRGLATRAQTAAMIMRFCARK